MSFTEGIVWPQASQMCCDNYDCPWITAHFFVFSPNAVMLFVFLVWPLERVIFLWASFQFEIRHLLSLWLCFSSNFLPLHSSFWSHQSLCQTKCYKAGNTVFVVWLLPKSCSNPGPLKKKCWHAQCAKEVLIKLHFKYLKIFQSSWGARGSDQVFDPVKRLEEGKEKQWI